MYLLHLFMEAQNFIYWNALTKKNIIYNILKYWMFLVEVCIDFYYICIYIYVWWSL